MGPAQQLFRDQAGQRLTRNGDQAVYQFSNFLLERCGLGTGQDGACPVREIFTVARCPGLGGSQRGVDLAG